MVRPYPYPHSYPYPYPYPYLGTTGEAWCDACSKAIGRDRKRVLCMSHRCADSRPEPQPQPQPLPQP